MELEIGNQLFHVLSGSDLWCFLVFQVSSVYTNVVRFAPMQCIIELKSSYFRWRLIKGSPPDFILPFLGFWGHFVIQSKNTIKYTFF